MTRQETAAIMAILRAAYPDYYRNMAKDEAAGIVALWADMFRDDDFQVVQVAVKQYIATDAKQFRPPHIGAIKEAIARTQGGDEMTEQEAWALVAKALKNGYYGADEEFSKLPPVLQRIVGAPSQLRDWAMMPLDEVQTVVASNFQRSYRARAQTERDLLKLPENVKAVVGRLADGMVAPGLPEAKTDAPEPKQPPTATQKAAVTAPEAVVAAFRKVDEKVYSEKERAVQAKQEAESACPVVITDEARQAAMARLAEYGEYMSREAYGRMLEERGVVF